MSEKYDVTVVGAGPTGLTIALLCRRLGLSVHILDKADGPLQLGRADALNSRTQEMFETAGVLSELLDIGLFCNTSSTFEKGQFTSRQNKWWTALTTSTYPNFLMVGQPEVERILSNHLDVKVSYGSTVMSIDEDEDVVRIQLEDGQCIETSFLVGADGARSFVRNHLGIKFEGTKPEMTWAVMDAFLDTDFPLCPEIITFQHEGQARISWIPRERNMARFYVLLDGEITLEKTQAEIKKFLAPHRIDFPQVEWFSHFDVKERIASTYFSEKKKIILAGDSAHIHSVNGGQGLNTGIADGFALAWRLNLASKNFGGKILSSYEDERLKSAKNVIDVSAQLVRSTIKTAAEYVSVIEQNANYITGAGVTYDSGTATVQGGSLGDFLAGKRCPELQLNSPDSSGRIYSFFPYGQFVVLLTDDKPLNIPDKLKKFVQRWRVGSTLSEAGGGHFEKNFTLDRDLHRGLISEEAEGKAIVVRPDLYIGYVGDAAGVSDYLEGIFFS